MQKITTSSEKETLNFAKQYARELRGGEIIGLIGELGAGKTVFTKGLASGLGIKQTITSPTFVLMKIYSVKDKKIKQLVHVDAYRINKPKELAAIGIEEYFNNNDTVMVIEWADKIKKILPKETRCITIKNQGETNRIINYI